MNQHDVSEAHVRIQWNARMPVRLLNCALLKPVMAGSGNRALRFGPVLLFCRKPSMPGIRKVRPDDGQNGSGGGDK